jgi:hypothetical protein
MTSPVVDYLVNYILYSYIDILYRFDLFLIPFFRYTAEYDHPIWGYLEELTTCILDK